ncbi:hypothetical protein I4Q36_08740 [Tuanshanicoccus lijuaniae]|uniref:hypothetical protein n=1 Tax=Aerococcaceae bacterium zg-1292 TaxID=2774330 RepID=UPI00193542B0|nr:hypothetical protein [Aerococcaceae bacterium zg-1292]QQA36868.1 hypothetical protein I4Q36_08740 [Aerococcaceae bacterium zg-1292]
MKNNIYFSQDPYLNSVSSFYEYATRVMEKSYDQEKIIEWINSHDEVLGDKKVWLLTGHAYAKKYEDWEKWILDHGYEVVIDCRGLGQVLIGETKFHHGNVKKSLESKGIAVLSLSRD